MQNSTNVRMMMIAASFLGMSASLGGSLSCPVIEPDPCWAPETYGRKRSKGNSFASRENSPRFRRTKFGTMKPKRSK